MKDQGSVFILNLCLALFFGATNAYGEIQTFFDDINPDIAKSFWKSNESLFEGQTWTITQGNGVWIDTDRVITVDYVGKPNIKKIHRNPNWASASSGSQTRPPHRQPKSVSPNNDINTYFTIDDHQAEQSEALYLDHRSVLIWNFLNSDQTKNLQFVLCFNKDKSVQILRSSAANTLAPRNNNSDTGLIILTLEKEPDLAGFMEPTPLLGPQKKLSSKTNMKLFADKFSEPVKNRTFRVSSKPYIDCTQSNSKHYFKFCMGANGEAWMLYGEKTQPKLAGSAIWVGNRLGGLVYGVGTTPTGDDNKTISEATIVTTICPEWLAPSSSEHNNLPHNSN